MKLKELPPDLQKEIQSLIEEKVKERVSLAVESALEAQDVESAELFKEWSARDNLRVSAKIQHIKQVVKENYSKHIKAIKKKHQVALLKEARSLEAKLIKNIGKYIDGAVEKNIPEGIIEESVRNKSAVNVLEGMRKMLAVDSALMQESVKKGIQDAKEKMEVLSENFLKADAKSKKLSKKLQVIDRDKFLAEKCIGLTLEESQGIKKLLGNKTKEYIAENFDYTLSLVKKPSKSKPLNKETRDNIVKAKAKTNANFAPKTLLESTDKGSQLYMEELKKF